MVAVNLALLQLSLGAAATTSAASHSGAVSMQESLPAFR